MYLDDHLALEARKRGVPGMTRMYNGYHKITGTYEQLTKFFRSNNVVVLIDFLDKIYHFRAVVIDKEETVYTVSTDKYELGVRDILTKLVMEMRVKPKIKM